MQLSSTAFENEKEIPVKYTCDGEGITPPLLISEVPDEADCLALIVEDPDAPNGLFIHLLVWNLSRDTKEIPEGANLNAIIGKNSAGKKEFQPPCPPSGTHRYFFKVYALDSQVPLDSNGDINTLMEAMSEHIIETAIVMGTYTHKD